MFVALLENQFPAATLTWKFLQNSVGRTERVGLVSRSVCMWEQASCAFGKKTGSRAILSLKYLVFPETLVFSLLKMFNLASWVRLPHHTLSLLLAVCPERRGAIDSQNGLD